MSRNAIAMKSSGSGQPVQALRSVMPAEEVRQNSAPSRMGNGIRGLKELVLRLLQEVDVLEHDELFAEMTARPKIHRVNIEEGIRFEDVVRQFETNLIRQALVVTGGNQARAARLLGIKANTLNYKIKTYNI